MTHQEAIKNATEMIQSTGKLYGVGFKLPTHNQYDSLNQMDNFTYLEAGYDDKQLKKACVVFLHPIHFN